MSYARLRLTFNVLVTLTAAVTVLGYRANAQVTQVFAANNYSMICSLGNPSDPTALRKCDPKLERQNEPALTVNPMNGALVGGVNDYRGSGVVLPSGATTGAWVSVLKSVNGRDFRGGLHPGCPLASLGPAGTQACDPQPLITGAEAADPSVVCSAWGACIYAFVSFTRGANAASQLVV